MSATPDLDAILAAWTDEGPTRLPDETRRAIAVATRTTRQSRPSRLPWRFASMDRTPRLALGALAVATTAIVVVVAAGIMLRSEPENGVGSSPLPYVTYTSPQYGYTVEIPTTWEVAPASEPWQAGDRVEGHPASIDRFRIPGSAIEATAAIAAQPVPEGTTPTTWLPAWEAIREDIGGHCFGSATPWLETTVAGLAGWHLEWRCNGATDEGSDWDESTFLSGDMGYVISGTPSMVETLVRSFRAP
jgi:hypothetical protein